MKEAYFRLPEEKQRRIESAGYRVFGQNSYKKSPVSEIAAEAGISKSLLFHYFQNKEELYLFLWQQASRHTIHYLQLYRCYEPCDIFEMMKRGMYAKGALMRKYPDLTAFVFKAFYEKEPAIQKKIHASYAAQRQKTAAPALLRAKESFREGIDAELVIQEMYWATEGYLYEALQKGRIDVDQMEKDFLCMLNLWQQVYGRKGETENAGH